MDLIYIEIYQKQIKYNEYEVSQNEVKHCDKKRRSKRVKLHFNGEFLHYFMNELICNEFYRLSFMNLFTSRVCENVNTLRFYLVPVEKEFLDYRWDEHLYCLFRERCELETALSWLSTLGGAFSALGDYMENCAEIAGKISYNQFKLALRLNDPEIMSRCRLYFSLSLIQRKQFKLARQIILYEFQNADKEDYRLISMCKGIWSKLQYEHSINSIKYC